MTEDYIVSFPIPRTTVSGWETMTGHDREARLETDQPPPERRVEIFFSIETKKLRGGGRGENGKKERKEGKGWLVGLVGLDR